MSIPNPKRSETRYDAIVIGGGAAGLMCAITAGKRGKKVLVLDHANKMGKKILMSGGGRCNFTNLFVEPDNFISANPHFCKSALKRYTQYDFIEWVESHQIPYHEKVHGQLFCDNKAKDILNMLLVECQQYQVERLTDTPIDEVQRVAEGFLVTANQQRYLATNLVVATGGLSIPTMGATGFGYELAKQFSIAVTSTQAALVPFTLDPLILKHFSPLSGVSLPARVSCNKQRFEDSVLITHRGLSGPAILQISAYWQPGDTVVIDWLPQVDLVKHLKVERQSHGKQQLKNALAKQLPNRFVDVFANIYFTNTTLAELSDKAIQQLADTFHAWSFKPSGTEGYRTAEVTLGGVDTGAISSKTMASLKDPKLYFIGEVLDVTGQLGGFNFQWAWSSGYAAGNSL